jgi:hypothetical protein
MVTFKFVVKDMEFMGGCAVYNTMHVHICTCIVVFISHNECILGFGGKTWKKVTTWKT